MAANSSKTAISVNIEFTEQQLSSYYLYLILAALYNRLDDRCDNNALDITTKADVEHTHSISDIIDYEPSAALNVVEVNKSNTVTAKHEDGITLQGITSSSDGTFSISVLDDYITNDDYVCTIFEYSPESYITTYTKFINSLEPNDFVTNVVTSGDGIGLTLNVSYHALPFTFLIKSSTMNSSTSHMDVFTLERVISSVQGDDDSLMTNEATTYTIQRQLMNKADVYHTHTSFSNDITVSGTLTASNVTSDNEERLATVEEKITKSVTTDHTHTIFDNDVTFHGKINGLLGGSSYTVDNHETSAVITINATSCFNNYVGGMVLIHIYDTYRSELGTISIDNYQSSQRYTITVDSTYTNMLSTAPYINNGILVIIYNVVTKGDSYEIHFQ